MPIRLRSFLVLLGCAGPVLFVAAYVLRNHVPAFAFAFFYLAVCLIAISRSLNRGQMLVYNSAFVFVALGLLELYLQVSPPAKTYYEGYNETYFTQDSDLGYVISPKARVVNSIRRAANGATIYDVRYTIDEHGLRQASPQSRGNDKAVFFFGDSFTFGEGVNDGDTLPQAFSRVSGVRVINFGIHGYGPHQMLRALETDRPRTIERSDPQAIVYTLLSAAHMFRAAGRATWDQYGPHYEPDNGTAKYIGPFRQKESLASFSLLNRILSHSRIYTELLDKRVRRFVTDADRKRLLAIILSARELSLSRYHAPFFVVLWDVHVNDGVNAEWIAQRLEKRGVPTLRLSVPLPALQLDSYYIPLDGHPTGKAYALVASALKSFLENNLTGSGIHASH